MKHSKSQLRHTIPRSFKQVLWRMLPRFFNPRAPAHTMKEATMARNVLRLSATAVASLVLVATLTGCGGGGGGSAPAAETPTATVQQVAVKVTSVTLTPSPSGTGSVVDFLATGTNGADGSANLTSLASWAVSMTGLPDYADSSKLSVTTAGRLQVATSATKKVDVVVPPSITSLIKAVASLKDSSASVEKNVTGACTTGLTPFGATCKFVGKAALSSSLTTSWISLRQIVAGKVVQMHTFDGKGLPVMKACVNSGISYSRVSCMLLDGKSSMTFDLYVDGTSVVVDSVYHAGEKEFVDPTTLAGTLCDASARTSFQLGDACITNSKVDTFSWYATFAGGTIDLGHLLSIAGFN